MKRPFAGRRPIGPISQLGGPQDSADDKDVMGISGTPMPDRPKNKMVLIYKLEGDNPVFVKDFANAIQRDIAATTRFTNPRVTFKKFGPSSKADFEEQAVIVQVKSQDIPFTDSEVHRIEDVINRIAKTLNADVDVSEIFIEQE